MEVVTSTPSSSIEEEIINDNDNVKYIWELSEKKVEIDPLAPFISLEAINRYSIPHLRVLADFYGIDRKIVPENASKSASNFPSPNETAAKPDKSHLKKNPREIPPVSVSFNKSSSLSSVEQKQYFELYQKYNNKVIDASTVEKQNEIRKLGELHSKVALEQEQFIQYMKETCPSRKKVYEFLTSESERYIIDLSKSKLHLAFKYPCWYKLDQILQFWSLEKILKEIPLQFTFEKVLLTLGLVPRLVLPLPNMKCILPKEYGKIFKTFPALKHKLDNIHPSKKVCSEDDIALSLAKKYNADVILSLSSFKALCILPPYEKNFELIITVKEIDGKKQVTVDKALCTAQRKARDQSYRFFKYSSKIQLTHFNPSRNAKTTFTAPTKHSKRTLVSHDFDMFENNADSILDLEVFGLSTISPSKATIHSPMKPNNQSPHKNAPPPMETVEIETTRKGSSSDGECSETIKNIIEEIEKGAVEDSIGKAKLEESVEEAKLEESIEKAILVESIEKAKLEESIEKAKLEEPIEKAKLEEPIEKAKLQESIEKANLEESIEKTKIEESIDKDKFEESIEKSKLESQKESSNLSDSESESDLIIDLNEPPENNEINSVDKTKNGTSVIEFSEVKIDLQNPSSEDDLPISHLVKNKLSPSRVISTRSKTKLNRLHAISDSVDASKEADVQDVILSPTEDISPLSPTPSNYGEYIDKPPIEIPLNAEGSDTTIEEDTIHPPITTKDNIRYSLFSLSNLKVLFRGKTDCLKPPQSLPFMIYPKMEYLSEHAAEESSVKQLCDQWSILVTHPGSQLARARINALTGELLMVEEITLDSFVKSSEVDKLILKPYHTLNQLHSMLEKFLSLDSGKYYLCHKRNESVASLYKESDKKSFNFHELLARRLNDLEDHNILTKDSNWVKLDPSVSLPHLLKVNKVPALFPPKGKSPVVKRKGGKSKSSKSKKAKKK